MSGEEPAVRLRAVEKTYGSGVAAVRALRGVDLQVRAGELLMLVGPSGCGKTTLLSIVSGVLDADSGAAAVFGVDWSDLSPRKRTARRGALVGFIFQQFNLVPTLTAVQNVSIPLLLRGVRRGEAMDSARGALADVGLADRADAYPSQLSGGMQQRVAVARAIIARPRLLVCDEPTANLDARTGHAVMELIHRAVRDKAAGEARCVIVVTHDNRIYDFADRIEQMEDGRVLPPDGDTALEPT